MRAKDFLSQLKKLDRMIVNKRIEICQLKKLASNSAGEMTGERVQSTPNPQRMGNAIAHYVDLEREIYQHIHQLIETRRDVISVIEQLNATEYDILHKLYVQNITLQDIATIYERRYEWATTNHGRALKHVQEILDEREEKTSDENA